MTPVWFTFHYEFGLFILKVFCFVPCPYMVVFSSLENDFTSKATESPLYAIAFLFIFDATSLLCQCWQVPCCHMRSFFFFH